MDENLLHLYGRFLNNTNNFIIGDTLGNVHLFNNLNKISSFKASNSPITTLTLHPELNEFLFNQSEMIIRSCSVNFSCGKFQPFGFKFCDEIDRTKWSNFTYLSSGLFVVATCSKGISLWDSIEGHFCCFYEDYPKEGIYFWFPFQSLLILLVFQTMGLFTFGQRKDPIIGLHMHLILLLLKRTFSILRGKMSLTLTWRLDYPLRLSVLEEPEQEEILIGDSKRGATKTFWCQSQNL